MSGTCLHGCGRMAMPPTGEPGRRRDGWLCRICEWKQRKWNRSPEGMALAAELRALPESFWAIPSRGRP